MSSKDLDSILDSALVRLRDACGRRVSIVDCMRIPGQASNRVYHRLRLSGADNPASIILVLLPDDPLASEEAGTGTARELPFCSMQRYLRNVGLPVPRIVADATSDGYILQEDLGEVTMFRELQSATPHETAASYRRAIELLVTFQEATSGPASSRCIGHDREFTRELLRWELDHFKEWLLLDSARAHLEPAEDRAVEDAFDDIAARLCEAPYVMAHRDFQSTNLMVRGGRLVLIDFQDALMAPLPYDLVSLLRDSYVHLSSAMVDELIGFYFDRAAHLLPVDHAAYANLFHLQTMQRKLKDAGRFVFIDRRKGNPDFLKWVEPTLRYVANAFDHLPRYAPLREILSPWLPRLASP